MGTTSSTALSMDETGNGNVTSTEADNKVTVYFALDSNNNDTPDIYEATIHYQVEGGTWIAVTDDTDLPDASTPKIVIVPLKKWSDETKAWENRTEAEINDERAVPPECCR